MDPSGYSAIGSSAKPAALHFPEVGGSKTEW